MKRFALLLLALCLVFAFTGCSEPQVYLPQENINLNYNNVSAENSSFWLTENACYYAHAPLYGLNYYAATQDKTEILLNTDNAAFAKIQAYGRLLYMLDWVNGSDYRLHTYDPETKEHTVLESRLTDVLSFFVAERSVYYIQEGEQRSLWVRSEDGINTQVAQSVLSAGVMDGKPVYLVQNGNEFRLYDYELSSGLSRQLGSFSCQIGFDEYAESAVSFTKDRVLLTVSKDAHSRLICYEPATGQTEEYAVDGWLWSVIAYEDYAFMVVVDDLAPETEFWNSALYRVALADGQQETIAQLKGMVDTYVASDECVYIVQSTDPNHIYRMDLNGEKTLVARW